MKVLFTENTIYCEYYLSCLQLQIQHAWKKSSSSWKIECSNSVPGDILEIAFAKLESFLNSQVSLVHVVPVSTHLIWKYCIWLSATPPSPPGPHPASQYCRAARWKQPHCSFWVSYLMKSDWEHTKSNCQKWHATCNELKWGLNWKVRLGIAADRGE